MTLNKIRFNYDSTLITEKSRISLGDILKKNSPEFSFLEEGRLVLFLISPSEDFVSLYVYCLENKLVPILLNYNIADDKIKDIIYLYKPEYIAVEKKSNFKYDSKEYSCFKILDTIEIYKTRVSPPKISFKNKLALLLSSSGSTGDPKMVRLSFENILCNAKSIIEYLEIEKKSISISNLPFSYSYGLSILNSYLFSGAKIVLTKESIIQRKFWELVDEFEVNSISGVPYTYEILEKLKFTKRVIPSLKVLTQAGGMLNSTLKLKFINYCEVNKLKFFTMYGQTEATARISYLEPKKAKIKPASIGKAIPDGKMYLLNSSGKKIIEPNKEGKITYEGKNVCLGYANSRKDLNNGNDNNFVLNTGDLGFFDEEGDFYITGRERRFIKINGNRFNLDHLENKLNEIFSSSGVIGIDQNLYVFYEEESDHLNISNYLKSLHIHKSNYKLINIVSIPRTESNKIKYSALWEIIKLN